MKRRSLWIVLSSLLALSLVLAACGGATPAPEATQAPEGEATEAPAEPAGELEIFSWWTAGGEAEALEAFFDVYSQRFPDVEVINAAVAGGAGTNAQAVLQSRMQGGDPPDSFQVHGGAELLVTWVEPGLMDPVSSIYDAEGWNDVYPDQLLEMLRHNGELYAVPANVHRGNVLWYNQAIFDEHGLEPPTTFEEFLDVAETLDAAGVTPLALGDTNAWTAAHLFEDVLLGVLGPEGYRGLWTGDTDWTGPEVQQALEMTAQMLNFVNDDHSALTWDGAAQLVVDGDAAMTIMGDWAAGFFKANEFAAEEDFGWVPAPGTQGSFVIVNDSFGLPQGAPHPENAANWLRVVGSKEGQEAFNPIKGSICARLDCDPSVYDAYLESSAEDFAQDELVPSEVHGSAAPPEFGAEFNDIVNIFVTNRDVETTQQTLQQACVDSGMCQ